MNTLSKEEVLSKSQMELGKIVTQLSNYNQRLGEAMLPYLTTLGTESGEQEKLLKAHEKQLAGANQIAKAFRQNGWRSYMGKPAPYAATPDLVKAELDVGVQTNLANVTGGQTLGYVSLDTQLARSTVRPSSFTLYQHLNKTMAKQVVDYWPTATSTGGAIPGAAFQSFTSVGSGTLQTNAGSYALNNITLKLAVDGRAITTALAYQNSFLDVGQQETINAGLSILSSLDFAAYYGNPTLFPNQFEGLMQSIPAANQFNFQEWFNNGPATSEGWSKQTALFNFIYEVAAQVTSYGTFGHITHAFMSPIAMGSLEGLTQQQLNNILNEFTARQGNAPIWDNGNLMGMRTRFGTIQFPLDMFINARNVPAQLLPGWVAPSGSGEPGAPTTVAGVSATNTAGSQFTTAYAGNYIYAATACDASMNETAATFAAPLGTAVAANGSVTVTVTPADANAAAFRVYRSALGQTTTTNPNAVRYIGTVAANGSSPVTFTDLNASIPGAENIFLLDLDDEDYAIDYRVLMPLSKISLYASNLFMPWAVAALGAVRNRIPQFSGIITNYVPDSADWDPLSPSV